MSQSNENWMLQSRHSICPDDYGGLYFSFAAVVAELWRLANFPSAVMRTRRARRAEGGKFAQNHQRGQQQQDGLIRTSPNGSLTDIQRELTALIQHPYQ
jgi:hypothetical protein